MLRLSTTSHLAAVTATLLFASTADAQRWIGAKTGEAVESGPIVGHVEVTGSKPEPSGAGPAGYREYQTFGRPTGDWVQVAIRPDPSDPQRAFDPASGRNFVFDRDRCAWIDTKTGETVESGPIVGHAEVSGSKSEPSGAGPAGYRVFQGVIRPTGDWVQVALRPDANDPTRAFDRASGRNFVFEPCPPKKPETAEQPKTNEQVGSAPPLKLNPFDQRILDAQNAERTSVGVPPLKWNEELAQHATEYAKELARTGQLVHSPRGGPRNRTGESAEGADRLGP